VVYPLLITATGWTWEYIDENMTLYRLACFTHHWLDSPPVHTAFAGFLKGMGGKSKRPQGVEVDEMPAHARKRMGFPDVPAQQRGTRTEHMPDLPPEMKDGQGYDAPDPKSPIFRNLISGFGEIHYTKHKSLGKGN
jgi:hypothetical protein